MANTVCYSGTSYSSGMILAHGSMGGLLDFGELIQIAIMRGKPFILKCLKAWYTEHLRGYELENTKCVKVVQPIGLSDIFPLAAYTVAGKRVVTLKRTYCRQQIGQVIPCLECLTSKAESSKSIQDFRISNLAVKMNSPFLHAFARKLSVFRFLQLNFLYLCSNAGPILNCLRVVAVVLIGANFHIHILQYLKLSE